MASLYSKGVLYKKTFNSDGSVKESVPFLTKTLSSLVITSDGKTVQDKIDELDTKKTYEVFDTYEEYKTKYDAGEIPEDMICVVMDK